ncbi:24-methylenesterol C-methyltransferase 2-like [Olea europaea subsp. europaea]|uniref:24-methylenesterol C-methyltransferase 2-like n=1 Tax=Olea europaea subsp. europaea TaxID=158383 RepID=A0A8S0S8G8_OLEEU|nr:24-methylenesterol C-methyltransferase 2-like [Olea europaea subsp. europaea]
MDSDEIVVSSIRAGMKREFAMMMKAQAEIGMSSGQRRVTRSQISGACSKDVVESVDKIGNERKGSSAKRRKRDTEENLGGEEKLYHEDELKHMEMIQGIERGDAVPGRRRYKDIAEVEKKVGFKVIKENDLAKAPASPCNNSNCRAAVASTVHKNGGPQRLPDTVASRGAWFSFMSCCRLAIAFVVVENGTCPESSYEKIVQQQQS